MFISGESHPSSNFKKLIAAAVCFTCLFSSVLAAQKSDENKPPKYDSQTETKMKGTVEEMKLPDAKDKGVVHLVAKTANETVDVYLCPKSFLDDMGISFSKGDEIAMTGSKVKLGEADLILAREVVRGTDTLVLRDQKGNPIWNWHH